MIKYYAYYSHGGYKDFYLGCNAEDTKSRYFLPLLQVHEQRLIEKPNAELQKEVDRQRQLPMLTVLTDLTVEYNYPDCLRRMVSHSGYKALYRRIDSRRTVFAIRDIPGTKDAYGRSTPFCIMMVGDSNDDTATLDCLARYMTQHLTDLEQFLSTLFVNDVAENGLRFDLRLLNNEIDRIAASNSAKPSSIAMEESDKLGRQVCLFAHYGEYTNALDLLQREQGIDCSCVDIIYSISENRTRRMNTQPEPPISRQAHSAWQTAPDKDKVQTLLSLIKNFKEQLPRIGQHEQRIAQLEEQVSQLERRISQLERLLNQSKEQ